MRRATRRRRGPGRRLLLVRNRLAANFVGKADVVARVPASGEIRPAPGAACQSGLSLSWKALINPDISGWSSSAKTGIEKAAATANGTTSPILKPLDLTREERDDLVAFLETL